MYFAQQTSDKEVAHVVSLCATADPLSTVHNQHQENVSAFARSLCRALNVCLSQP
jgi:hypothetical protein